MPDHLTDQPHAPTEPHLRLMVLGPPLLVLALLCGLGVGSLHMMAAVRAYVTGESLWSKARSDAVMALDAHVQSGEPQAFARFEAALQVNDGDRRAREALLRDPVDVAAARAGFLAGGNRASDIDGMIGLFRLFGQSWIFRDALQAWVAGDRLLAELRAVAAQHRAAHGPSTHAPADTRARIRDINQRLLAQEKQFIGSLNEAAHTTENILQACLLAATLLMSGAYTWVALRTLQRRQRDAQAMHQARERWDLAVRSSGLGRFDLDIDNQRYTLDARAAELHGLAPHALSLDRDALRQRIHPDDRDATRRQLDDAILHGHIATLRYRVVQPDGRVRHVENTGRVGLTHPHRGLHLMGVLRDVTDEVAQAQAEVQRDAAERVATSQRAFLSRLSHELRTPLNAILGFAQLLDLDRSSGMSAPQHQQVQWILRAGQQLLALVEDVLDLSKVEAGEVSMRPQTLVLQQVVRDCLPLVEAMRAERHVHIVDALPTAPLLVTADPQRLQQVFINLLSNGCKYNRDGGQLSVSAREEPDAIVIDLCDTGLGMTAAEQAELFQPFKRPTQGSAHIEGTGLGLYIVRQLLQRMHGSVTVHSEAGQGSCFTLRLPRGDAPRKAHTDTEPASQALV
ncbi:signal transduction histidine kinase [Aquabacterium commune]|uniref:histidine kinase n=1 Tax=Aquabacterium commune TaxID=70586 RepID=A0A4R6R5U1_9BURK|nr:ATP-binding protein [Aquabacterium commune]TDP80975.1 signal transduction histidine kinase [Aquabacterium commune]